MHDSFTPPSVPMMMANMMLVEVIVGAPGSGLFGMLLFALVAVFVAGLMVGRTPEYLGKKIQSADVKMAVLALLVVPATILVLTSVAAVLPVGLAGLSNAGPHGFSELLYAYTSAAATNGSAFAGLSANTNFFNLTLALAMLCGRFLVIVPVLAIAGSLAEKAKIPILPGTLPTDGFADRRHRFDSRGTHLLPSARARYPRRALFYVPAALILSSVVRVEPPPFQLSFELALYLPFTSRGSPISILYAAMGTLSAGSRAQVMGSRRRQQSTTDPM